MASKVRTQQLETEEYFRDEIKPLIEEFVGACIRHRPDDVAQFACHFFGSAQSLSASDTGMNGLSREDYEICFLKPAKRTILEPLVHRLAKQMPPNPRKALCAVRKL